MPTVSGSKTNSITTAVTVQRLRECFSTHGLPDVIVSDNGIAFTSEDFALFLSENGIKHITSAPKHPTSNGFAERYVRTFKETMKKMVNEKGSLDTKLSRFLLSYRTTPQTTTGKTPGELLMNRKLKTRLDLVNPLSQNTTRTRVEDKQLAQKKKHDSQAPLREFQVNDPVFVKNTVPSRYVETSFRGQALFPMWRNLPLVECSDDALIIFVCDQVLFRIR